MSLLGGAWIFLGFLVFMVVALVLSTYTRRGSGIDHHPYAHRYSDAPGAKGQSRVSGHDGIATLSSRGTK